MTQVLSWAALVLVPLIPAILLHRRLSRSTTARSTVDERAADSEKMTHVEGGLLGIQFRAVGPVATYVVVFCLGLYGKDAFASEPHRTEAVVRLEGSSQELERLFLQERASQLQIHLIDSESPEKSVVFENFLMDLDQRTLRRSIEVPSELRDAACIVKVEPRSAFVEFAPARATPGERLDITLYLDASNTVRDWNGALSAQDLDFSEEGETLHFRKLHVFEHGYPEGLENLLLPPTFGYGEVVWMQIDVRRVDRSEFAPVLDRFDLESLSGLDPERGASVVEWRQQFDLAFGRARSAGQEVASRLLTNSEIPEIPESERYTRGNLAVDGMSVLVGPVNPKVAQSERLVVTIETKYEYDRGVNQLQAQPSLREVFSRPYARSVFFLRGDDSSMIDLSAVRPEFFRNITTPTTPSETPLLWSEGNDVLFAQGEVDAGSTVVLKWAWDG